MFKQLRIILINLFCLITFISPIAYAQSHKLSAPMIGGIAATATGDKECFNGSSDLLQFSINGNVVASAGYIPSTTSHNLAVNVSPGTYTLSDQPFNVPGGTCQLNQPQSVNIQNNSFTPVTLSYQFKSSNPPSGRGIAATATGDVECMGGNDTLVFSANGNVAASVAYRPSTSSTNVTVNVAPGAYTISDQAFNVAGGTCRLSQSPSVSIQNNTYTPVTLSYHFSSSSPGQIGIAATASGDKECFTGSSDLLQFSINGTIAASIGYIPRTTTKNIAMNVAPGMYSISGQAFNVPGGTCQLTQSISVNLQNNTFTPVNLSYQFKSSNPPSRGGVALTARGDAQCMGARDTLIFSLNGSVAASIPYTTSTTSTNIDVAPGTYTISDQAFNVTGGTCKLSQSPSVTVQNNTYTPVSLSYTFTATPPTSSGISATATGDTECLGGNDTLAFSVNGNTITSAPYIPSATATKINVLPGTYTISGKAFTVSGGTCQLSQSPSVTVQNNAFTAVNLPYHFTATPPNSNGITATADGDTECMGGNDTLVFSTNGNVAASVSYTPSATAAKVTVNVSPGTYIISDQSFNVAGGTCKLSHSQSVNIQNNTYPPVSLSYHFTPSTPGSSGITVASAGDAACAGAKDTLIFLLNGNVAASAPYTTSCDPTNINVNAAPGTYTISDQPFAVSGGTCKLTYFPSVTLEANSYTPINLSYSFSPRATLHHS